MEGDFFSSSAVVSFIDGQTTATAVLFLQNDAVPEGNETFILEITGTRPGNYSPTFSALFRMCNISI